MSHERNKRATNRRLFADMEHSNLRQGRANSAVQTGQTWSSLARTGVRIFGQSPNRISPPLCKSMANCCIVPRDREFPTGPLLGIHRSREWFPWKLALGCIAIGNGSLAFSFFFLVSDKSRFIFDEEGNRFDGKWKISIVGPTFYFDRLILPWQWRTVETGSIITCLNIFTLGYRDFLFALGEYLFSVFLFARKFQISSGCTWNCNFF